MKKILATGLLVFSLQAMDLENSTELFAEIEKEYPHIDDLSHDWAPWPPQNFLPEFDYVPVPPPPMRTVIPSPPFSTSSTSDSRLLAVHKQAESYESEKQSSHKYKLIYRCPVNGCPHIEKTTDYIEAKDDLLRRLKKHIKTKHGRLRNYNYDIRFSCCTIEHDQEEELISPYGRGGFSKSLPETKEESYQHEEESISHSCSSSSFSAPASAPQRKRKRIKVVPEPEPLPRAATPTIDLSASHRFTVECPHEECSYKRHYLGRQSESHWVISQLKVHINQAHPEMDQSECVMAVNGRPFIAESSSSGNDHGTSSDDEKSDDIDENISESLETPYFYRVRCPYRDCKYIKENMVDQDSDQERAKRNTFSGLYNHMRTHHWPHGLLQQYVEKNRKKVKK